MRTSLNVLPIWILLILSIGLVACGGSDPTETAAPAATDPPATEEVVLTDASAESTTESVVETPAPLDVIREVVLTRAEDTARVAATLYQLMSIPVDGGETVVFHWEDQIGEVTVGCSGHAVTNLVNGAFEVAGISGSCGPTTVETPITIFPSQRVTPTGEALVVVYGEVYSQDVVAIRAFVGEENVPATVSGGAYYVELPVGSIDPIIRAYDADANVLYEGMPGSGG